MKLELSTLEVRLIAQSLEHCLETCKHKKEGKSACEDCDAARALLDRVKKGVRSEE